MVIRLELEFIKSVATRQDAPTIVKGRCSKIIQRRRPTGSFPPYCGHLLID